MAAHRVLIVEDEHDIAGLIKHTLERTGETEAEIVGSGDAALKAVADHPPDLILLDLNLPVVSGTEVCRILRSRADAKHLPIIMLTCRTSEDDRVSGLEVGADDYITKPFSLRELTARVRAALRRTAKAQEPCVPGYTGAHLVRSISPSEPKADDAPEVLEAVALRDELDRETESDLEALLGRMVQITNDANCFALSEATDGGGAGAEVVFGVILGTGVGAGIAVRGRVLTGPNAIAGEWGHNPLPWPRDDERPGPPCFCGHTGCIETLLSGPGLERDHLEVTGERLISLDIAARASAGDSACEASMRRYEERLARSLAHVINILDPDTIVLGGGMSNIDRLYRSIPELWTSWVFSDRVDTNLVRHVHGDSSGVRGAAWLGAA